jgi:hypothetical protein
MAKRESRRTGTGEQDERDDLYEEITEDEDIIGTRVGRSGQWGDPTDPPVVEVSFEEIMELQDELEGDTSLGDIINTAHGDGSTENVQIAMDQGLVYTPPTDPPVIPSDDLQGVEIAAGFASSIDDMPDVDNWDGSDPTEDDEEVESDLRKAIRYNSETTHLEDVRIYVRDGIAYLRGTVMDDDDIALVEGFIRDLDMVDEIQNGLVTEDDL